MFGHLSEYGYMLGYDEFYPPYIGVPGGSLDACQGCFACLGPLLASAALLASDSNRQPSDPKEWDPYGDVAGATCPNFGRMLGHSLAILRPAMNT
jgi:hypothetical protein